MRAISLGTAPALSVSAVRHWPRLLDDDVGVDVHGADGWTGTRRIDGWGWGVRGNGRKEEESEGKEEEKESERASERESGTKCVGGAGRADRRRQERKGREG
eukprot:1128033-Rhodomonas_salina.1